MILTLILVFLTLVTFVGGYVIAMARMPAICAEMTPEQQREFNRRVQAIAARKDSA